MIMILAEMCISKSLQASTCLPNFSCDLCCLYRYRRDANCILFTGTCIFVAFYSDALLMHARAETESLESRAAGQTESPTVML